MSPSKYLRFSELGLAGMILATLSAAPDLSAGTPYDDAVSGTDMALSMLVVFGVTVPVTLLLPAPERRTAHEE